MATRPRVTRVELDAAIARITSRHRKVDDKNLEQLGTDPRDVHDYLHKYSGSHLPRWVRQADVADDLIIQVWLWWEDQRRLNATLEAGRRLGLFNSQLGGPLGIGSSQGVNDLRDRLAALLRYDRPDEKLTREERRIRAVKELARDAEQNWVERNQQRLHAVVADILREAERYEVDERDWLEELEHDHTNGGFTPQSLAILGLALSELRTAPKVVSLAPHPRKPYKVHRVLAAADQLRSEFARIS